MFFTSLAACDLTKEVEIELPEYERQPVVECYLEPGQKMRLLLTRSNNYFDTFETDLTKFVQNIVLDGATVTLEHEGIVDTLRNVYDLDLVSGKIFNYSNPKIVDAKPGVEYTLFIRLENGQTISAKTVMLPKIEIDSVVVQWSAERDTLARVLTYATDDSTTENYYRRLLNYGNLQDSLPQQDFLFNDQLNQTNIIAFGTGYELKEGDKVYNTIYHITKEYSDYVESVGLAIFGNLSPFAQPSQIKSNVHGTANPLGIFTCLVYDRDTTIIKR